MCLVISGLQNGSSFYSGATDEGTSTGLVRES